MAERESAVLVRGNDPFHHVVTPLVTPSSSSCVAQNLPQGADAELRLRGDEVFGRRITVCYFRDQTEEEAEIERRYAEASREAKERELARLQAELGVVCYAAPGKRGKLRIVA